MNVLQVVYGDAGRAAQLAAGLITDLVDCSRGIARVVIVATVVHPGPAPVTSANTEQNGDYAKIIADNDIVGRLTRGEIDEVWLWGDGHSGWFESCMIGRLAFNVNGPVIGAYDCPPAILMGFNSEDGTPEAIHSFGHRAEWCVGHLYGDTPDYGVPARIAIPANDYQRFLAFEAQCPGHAGFGNVHFPPLGTKDYQYDSAGCEVWGQYQGSYQEGFLRWWFSAMPADWWRSILRPLARWRVVIPGPALVDLLRLNNHGAYLNTTSPSEAAAAVKSYGFTLEGVVGRVFPPA